MKSDRTEKRDWTEDEFRLEWDRLVSEGASVYKSSLADPTLRALIKDDECTLKSFGEPPEYFSVKT